MQSTMEKPHYSPLQRLIHKVISFRPILLFAPFIMHHIDKLFLKVTGGRTTFTTLFTGIPMLMITTTGAKSGLPRTTPLSYIRDPQDATRFAVIGSNWGQHKQPAWYHNLKANSTATCLINAETGQYSAQEVSGAEYDRLWQAALDTYSGYSLYRRLAGKRRHVPIMLMTAVKRE